MTFMALFAVLCGSMSLAFSIDIPAVGSIDNRACAGGVVTKALIFKTAKGDDVLTKEVACPTGSLTPGGSTSTTQSISQKPRAMHSRQLCPLPDPCTTTCENNGEFASSSDCSDLFTALLDDGGITDPLVIAPETILAFELGSCEMAYENLLETEDKEICKSTFGAIGVGINENCAGFGTGVCVAEESDYAFITASTE